MIRVFEIIFLSFSYVRKLLVMLFVLLLLSLLLLLQYATTKTDISEWYQRSLTFFCQKYSVPRMLVCIKRFYRLKLLRFIFIFALLYLFIFAYYCCNRCNIFTYFILIFFFISNRRCYMVYKRIKISSHILWTL